MLFHSQSYLLFFVAVFAVYWSLPWHRARVYLLVAASITFYAFWSQWLALLVTATTVMDYLLARAMDGCQKRHWRRLLLATSLSVNLGLLCYFKYANFFLDALREALASVGATASFPYLSVIVPFGISFYTFEAISYAVDVYRRKIPAEKSLPNFLLFILFFPHLVAGPIVRAPDFLPQARRPKRFSWLRAQVGVEYLLIGLFKKMVIADAMAIYSDPVISPDSDPSKLRTSAVWLGVVAFTVRVYCDFSGYSDMALGSAHLLGYKLTANFRLPFLAVNIGEFWRRWHVSLGNWLRDYVFVPLGGSRGGALFVARNLLITFFLCGLWHGAAWSWVLWGTLNGVLLVLHAWFHKWCAARPRLGRALETRPGVVGRWALTMFCVLLTMTFAQPSLHHALAALDRMFHVVGTGDRLPMHGSRVYASVALLAIGHWLTAGGWVRRMWRRAPAAVLATGYAALVVLSLLLCPDTSREFFYFQF